MVNKFGVCFVCKVARMWGSLYTSWVKIEIRLVWFSGNGSDGVITDLAIQLNSTG